jgi:ABC-type uncharacterized transport system YnjBCD ATPase subunit
MKASANPFRSSSVEQLRYALSTDELEALVDHVLSESCSCLLGPKGTGKTTLLEDLEPYLQQRGLKTHWIRLTLESTKADHIAAVAKMSSLKSQYACLFDGAEVLNFWQWRRVCGTARSNGFTLIATLHRRRGVPILFQTQPNWLLAEQFVQQLAGSYCNAALRERARLAFKASHGNMREVFRVCYLFLAKENFR